MTDWLLALVPTWGPWLLMGCTFLSCFGLPIPSSILLLAAGGFVAAGDLSLPASAGAAWAGAFAGDQAVYVAGRRSGAGLLDRLGARAAPVARARGLLARRGAPVVFLSRWLLSPLGPYVNVAAGAAGLGWRRFTAWGTLGEGVWVGLYLGLGVAFAGNLAAASALGLRVLALGAGLGAAAALGAWLVHALRAERSPA